MPLSNHERLVLAQLESSFADESEHLARIERNARRRRVLTRASVPIGLLVGLVLVVLGFGLNNRAGILLAVVGYVVVVASSHAGVRGARRVLDTRPTRRQKRA